ncbi:hypothetical protein Tco_0503792 [Tanacetum coccineum]
MIDAKTRISDSLATEKVLLKRCRLDTYIGALYCLLVVTTDTRHSTAGDHKYWCFTDAKKCHKKVWEEGALYTANTISTARLGVNVYTASYHEFVMLRIVLSTAHWNFSTPSSLFILLVSIASVSRYRTTKIDGMADIEWHTEMDIRQN